MSLDDRAFEKLGKAVADEIGTGDSEFTLKRQEPLFLSAMAQAQKLPQKKPRTKMWIVSSVAAIAAAAAMLLALTLSSSKGEFRFSIDGTGDSETGIWITASGERTRDIAFEQGSRFLLENGAMARVTAAGEENVQIEFRRGRLNASVRGNGHTRWVIDAAPYTITVLGTKFTVDRKAADAIVVDVTEGTVLVQGADFDSHGIKVSAGFKLTADAAIGAATLSARNEKEAKTKTATTTPDKTESAADAEKAGRSKGTARIIAAKTAPDKETSSWLERYAASDFDGAMKAARAAGLEKIINSASADDLWKLSDAARNVRDDATAKSALSAYRSRFPSGRKAPVAAFLLGRMAAENERNPAKAAQLFDLCLKESGNGALAQDALGRLMGALRDSGQDARAKEAARKYLSRYSDGVHSRLAKSILATE